MFFFIYLVIDRFDNTFKIINKAWKKGKTSASLKN